MACSTAPTAGNCTDEVDGQLNSDGTYQLPLFPGTWWVQGVADVYTGLSDSRPPRLPARRRSWPAPGTRPTSSVPITVPGA